LNAEKKIISNIFEHLAKEDDMVVYGPTNTIRMLD